MKVFTRDGNYAVYRRPEDRSAPRRCLHASRKGLLLLGHVTLSPLAAWFLKWPRQKKRRYKCCLRILKGVLRSHGSLKTRRIFIPLAIILRQQLLCEMGTYRLRPG